MNILVLGGCGAMGTEATRDLVRTSEFTEILVADADLPRAQALCEELGDRRLRAVRVDAGDSAALRGLMAQANLVLNCTPYTFGLIVTEAAIAARRPLLDLGGLYNTPRQLALDEQARQAGITIVLGMGATPGITNLMARAGADQMSQVHEVHIAFATFRRMAPSPGLLSTVLDEFSPSTMRFYYEEGRFVEVPPFAGEREVEFAPPVGRQRVYIVPHSETHTLPRFLPGVRRVDVRGTWRPEIMAALRLYAEVGLLSADPVAVGDVRIAPKELLRTLYLQSERHREDEGEYAFFLHVEVVGSRDGREVVATYNLSHPPRSAWGTTATARVTGIPASIGAQRLARGEVTRTGVLAPEAAFEPTGFFRALAERDIFISEQVQMRRRFLATGSAGAL
ncbi:MAG: saccharopine dehydrogenase NADP-binding domain-containing protein [Myxococcales bacterium]|nr:saccharopine dehydrogenase NADP-binding domain-containing protein [Myxococcota bacterium]MDW8280455.1 saccharopine dehydrogenase NADP-binding domain-containing protein [Myxococcales bacterium]